MLSLKISAILVLLLLLAVTSVAGYRDTAAVAARYQFQVGCQIERGIRSGYFAPVEYTYSPTLLEVEFQRPVSRSKAKKWYLDYVVQPQFNIVTMNDHLFSVAGSRQVQGWEAGINLGLALYRSLFTTGSANKILVYALAGTGPHYVSSTPSRQSKGFIFSDNLRLGLRIPISRDISFDLRGGIRHISNASLKLPNKGVDNTLIGMGIHYIRR